MGALFQYMQATQRLINDQAQRTIDPGDLIEYVNRARRETAMRTQCLRVLTPISGSIVSASVTAGGAGYTSPTVTVSAPDFPGGTPNLPGGAQAIATAQVLAGAIGTIDIQYGGSGYFQPVITISDPTGTGAAATASTSLLNTVNQNQEVYPFSGVDLSQNPGVGGIIAVKSVALIYSNFRFSLAIYDFSTYQAMIRNFPTQYSYVPTVGAQYGQGANGSFYLYPLPSQRYQMEWDCFCYPSDLATDTDTEALSLPWTDGVPFLAAYFAYLEMQNWNAAAFMQKQFDDWMTRYSRYARPGRRVNPYGRPMV
jgi:hypothetical protein